jgi:hypothetical protein
VQLIMNNFKHFLQIKSEDRAKHDPLFAEDQLTDHNNIEKLMYWEYVMNTMKLVLMITNFTFVIAHLWKIFCDFTFNFNKEDPRFDESLKFEDSEINN